MTAAIDVEQAPTRQKPRGVSRATVLILGVVVIPVALGFALNSYGPLTEESALRMAFTTVAGQTIAILSGVVALVLTVKRGYAWPAILGFAVIAALIASFAVGQMASAGDLLLTRLDLIADVDELNR